jgi:single-strand DNA-binding protein
MALNTGLISGNLTAAPELGTTKNGKPFAKFTVAVNDSYNKSNCDFIPVVVFGKAAEVAGKYLDKASAVIVEGRMSYQSYTDSKGVARKSFQLIGNFQFQSGSKKAETANAEAAAAAASDAAEVPADEIPF